MPTPVCVQVLSRVRRGFTLIKLLVVVAIIVILAGLVVPATGMVRSQAAASVCKSNLRQCVLAHLAYANDNDGDIPHSTRQIGTSNSQIPWMFAIADYFDKTSGSTAISNMEKATQCPTFKRDAWPVIGYSGTTTHQFWGYLRNNYLRQNGQATLQVQPNPTGGSIMGDWCQSGWCTPFNLATISYQSKRLLIGDGYNSEHRINRGNGGITYSRTAQDSSYGVLGYQYGYLLSGQTNVAGVAGLAEAMANDAHRGKRSYAMVDGSARSLNDSAQDSANELFLSVMDPSRY